VTLLRRFTRWFKRLFKKRTDRRIAWPTAEQVAALPWFEELQPKHIYLIETAEGARRAQLELAASEIVGFDTESKPTFLKNQKSKGPHVAQFATRDRAFVFMLHVPECRRVVGLLIQSPSLEKVGFGLGDDVKRIREKLQIQPRSVLDLETVFSAHGYGRNVGVKIAVAIRLGRQFRKTRRIAASNWGAPHLSDRQIIYAANDAYAALLTYLTFDRPPAR
jgi:ribonuclease D